MTPEAILSIRIAIKLPITIIIARKEPYLGASHLLFGAITSFLQVSSSPSTMMVREWRKTKREGAL